MTKMSDLFGFDIAASGLTAQRLRMDVISNNLANANTTRTPEGGPYKRQTAIFESRLKELIMGMSEANPGNGVRVVGIAKDKSLPMMIYDPGHPDANDAGYVAMPNVNVVTEMVDMMSASRAYEANVMAMNAAKAMASRAIDILRV
jgi:flagellar basal-body rod protein FlgC